jgi:hypothetical protein
LEFIRVFAAVIFQALEGRVAWFPFFVAPDFIPVFSAQRNSASECGAT